MIDRPERRQHFDGPVKKSFAAFFYSFLPLLYAPYRLSCPVFMLFFVQRCC
jgi:hypothetical protein